MASFRLWTIQNSPMPARADHCGAPTHRAGHPKSCRSPLRDHFDFQANIATCRSGTIQNSPRARARAWEFCTNHTNMPEPLLTLGYNRWPLRGHFGSQANSVTFRLWAIQHSPRAAARWIFQDSSGFLQILQDSSGSLGSPRDSVRMRRFLRIPQGSFRFFWCLSSSSGFIGILCGSAMLFRIPLVSIGFYKIPQDSMGFRRAFRLLGLPTDSAGFFAGHLSSAAPNC